MNIHTPINTKNNTFRLIWVLSFAFLLVTFFFFTSAYAKPSGEHHPDFQYKVTQDVIEKIHPKLLRMLLEGISTDYIPIIIEWKQDTETTRRIQNIPASPDKLAARQQIISLLITQSANQTRELTRFLSIAQNKHLVLDYRAYWISPVIAAKISPSILPELTQQDNVIQIRLDEKIYLENLDYTPMQSGSSDPYTENLVMIQIDRAQKALGLDGSGVVIASLDSGVDWQHPALLNKYRGYHPHGVSVHAGNWYVVTGEPYIYPGDGYGHGTHTTGIIVGDDGADHRIGVAPGAKWIAVKLFNNQGYTYESWTHDAYEWVMAPDGDPAKAPDIVNNSWGSNNGSDTRFRNDIQSLRAAGILPVFSAGNNGPSGGTIASPASYPEALAVGAVDYESAIASFSSRGPSIWGEIKPEIVAPGVDILSSYPGGGYYIADGTSQSGPHIAGVAALILQADPSRTPDQIEAILLSTAQPLGIITPNNNTGFGLVNAYTAGLQVTQKGEIKGLVLNNFSNPVAYPQISANPRDGDGYTQTLTIAGDVSGAFSFILKPGFYDISATAFSYNSHTQYMVEVISDTVAELVFNLLPLPVGSIFGQITDATTGEPISATLEVQNTSVSTQSDPNTGAYSLDLPEGTWQINIKSPHYRIDHLTPSVTAGYDYLFDITMTPAPTVLVVDSGCWYYNSQVNFYTTALSQLNYLYTVLPIRNPFGLDGQPSDLPDEQDLSPYDIVIWSAPDDSPGILGAGDVISGYLTSGGRFLISGQDVAYYDASFFSSLPSQHYLTDQLKVWFSSEGNLSPVSGVSSTPLDGIELSINTTDSASNQAHPDASELVDRIMSQPFLTWPNQTIAAIATNFCQPHHAVWLGAGYEGLGPETNRINALDKLINWLSSPHDEYHNLIDPQTHTLIGSPGSNITTTINLHNIGTNPDNYTIVFPTGAWTVTLTSADGTEHQDTFNLNLASCTMEELTATISIPASALREEYENISITAFSANDPSITATMAITAKTPASILFVDDERWYNHEEKYLQALQTLKLPFDTIVTNGDNTPSLETLLHYPLVLWTTGYDWYAPLTDLDENNLTTYLDQGGRLLISSQDMMDLRGDSVFTHQRLGVTNVNLTITPTHAIPIVDNIFSLQPEIWRLVYPFNNWSDGLTPTATATATLVDSTLHNLGIANQSNNWRTIFYSFPLETLDQEPIQLLLDRSLMWISQFGESSLDIPSVAAEGSQIPITLTVGLANDIPRIGSRVVVMLPLETTPVPGSLTDGWLYNADSNSLTWQGDLAPGTIVELIGTLQLSTDIPDGKVVPFYTYFYDDRGLVITSISSIFIDDAWVNLKTNASQREADIGETVFFTLTQTNIGSIQTQAYLTETIPSGFILLTQTLTSTEGSITVKDLEFNWVISLPPESGSNLYFQGYAQVSEPGARLNIPTSLWYPNTQLFTWETLVIPDRFFLPWLGK
jgi:uncharacterized repeat protein (TIGR01451 family)